MSIAVGAWLLIAGAAACVSQDEVDRPNQDVARPFEPNVQFRTAEVRELPEQATPPDGCELAIPDDGPCSLACDPDAVIDQFVPAGVCTIFECPTVDGSKLNVGGCHL